MKIPTTLLAALLTSRIAMASLISIPHDLGQVTYDTDTRLEWLRTTAFSGSFVSDVLVQIDTDAIDFNYATRQQVEEFIRPYSTSPQDVLHFIDVVGRTGNGSAEEVAVQGYYDRGVAGLSYNDHVDRINFFTISQDNPGSGLDVPDPWLGHWLVRKRPQHNFVLTPMWKSKLRQAAEPLAVVPVPEPSHVVLVLGSLILLCVARRHSHQD